MSISTAPNRLTHLDELSFPGTPVPDFYPEIQVPFPPVEAYCVDPLDAPSTAFLVVRESLDTHLMVLLEVVRSMRPQASQEDVRRLSLVRSVVLGALESLA